MMSNTFKRFLSLMMALMVVITLMPVGAISVKAADNTIADAAVFFSDLHTQRSNYKEGIISSVFSAIANDGLHVSSVTSVGDAFSVNEESSKYDGNVGTITGYIHTALQNNTIPVNYAWSDHDRYAKNGTEYLDSESGFIYGVGDDDANYYIYELSMADMSTDDRYNTGVFSSAAEVSNVIDTFKATAATLDKTKPLFITSHMPLLDRRNDNGHAYAWATAINEVAAEMDVIFLHGHNHGYDDGKDYNLSKNSTISVCSDSDGNSKPITLNFTHLSAGYLDPPTTNDNTRQGTVLVAEVRSDAIDFTTYSKDGIYTGDFRIYISVLRDHSHIHSYEKVTDTVDATCTETGSVTKVCTICGKSKVEITPALGHDYESVVTDPSCTEGGFTTYTCKVCGDSDIKDSTDALGHNYTKESTATCTQDGVMVYTCAACRHSYEGEAVEALGHNYSNTVIDPTCAANGYTAHVCSNCGDSYNDNEVAALGHKYTSVVTAPTCTENGFTTYTCETCGHNYKADEVTAPGHDYESVVTPPTTEAEGYTTHTCKVCGDVKVDSKVPPVSHEYESVTVEANCFEDGSITYTCTKCGDVKFEIIPALGHNYTDITYDPTCTEDGSILYLCNNCDAAYVDIIPATGHDLESVTVDPTCTTYGYTTSTCTKCRYSDTVIIPKAEHNYIVSKMTEATCTSIGFTTYACDDCGNKKNDDFFSALGHNYQTEAVAPTCTEKGYTAYTCATCGDSYKENYIAATGHTNSTTVTAPTCTENGFTTYTCSTCSEVTVGDYVKATGHRYDCVESGNQLVYTCKVCNHSYSVTVEPNFIYTKASSLDSGESYVITLYSSNKYYALSHKNNRISAVPVEVSSNRVISEVTEDLLWDHNNHALSYKSNGITYLLDATSTKLSLSISKSSSVVYSGNKMKVGTNYMRYASNTITMNKSATTAYLFIQDNA